MNTWTMEHQGQKAKVKKLNCSLLPLEVVNYSLIDEKGNAYNIYSLIDEKGDAYNIKTGYKYITIDDYEAYCQKVVDKAIKTALSYGTPHAKKLESIYKSLYLPQDKQDKDVDDFLNVARLALWKHCEEQGGHDLDGKAFVVALSACGKLIYSEGKSKGYKLNSIGKTIIHNSIEELTESGVQIVDVNAQINKMIANWENNDFLKALFNRCKSPLDKSLVRFVAVGNLEETVIRELEKDHPSFFEDKNREQKRQVFYRARARIRREAEKLTELEEFKDYRRYLVTWHKKSTL